MNSVRSAVSGPVFAAAVEECEAVGEIQTEGVLGEDGAALGIEARDDMHGVLVPIFAQNPFAIAREADAPGPVGGVAQGDGGELERGADGHINSGFGEQARISPLKHAIAVPVPADAGRRGARGTGHG